MQRSWHRACVIVASWAAIGLALGCGNGGKAGLVAPGPDGAEQLLILVSNEASNDISFIDAASGNVLGALPVGKRPRGLKVSPDGRQLYVALSGSPRGGPNVDESKLPPPDRNEDGIGVIELESGAVRARLPSGNDPEALDASPDGRYLAVANEDSAQLSLVDATSGALVARVDVGVEPEGVRFSPDGHFVYVTSEANDRVDVVDVAARRVLTHIPTGKRPRNVLFSPDGERAYVSCELSGRVDVIDARSHRALASISIDGDPKPLPMGLALDDSQSRLYVSLGRAGEVAVVDAGALRLIGRVSNVGARPWGLVLSPDAERLYTANGPSGDVSVIDTRSLQVIQRIGVGTQPWGLGTVRVHRAPPLHAGI
jgi:YVTN family beta-propeller protein